VERDPEEAPQGKLMGRNARRRAEKREGAHPHGVDPPDEGERKAPTRCPRCGSTNIVITPSQSFGVAPGLGGIGGQVDIICGNCNWQGEMNAGVW